MTSDDLSNYHRRQLIDQLSMLDVIISDLIEQRWELRRLLGLRSFEGTACTMTDTERERLIEIVEKCLLNVTYKSYGKGQIINLHDYKKGK